MITQPTSDTSWSRFLQLAEAARYRNVALRAQTTEVQRTATGRATANNAVGAARKTTSAGRAYRPENRPGPTLVLGARFDAYA